jgi:hypothetical protein
MLDVKEKMGFMDFEESGLGLIKVLSRHLTEFIGGTEKKNNLNVNQKSRYPGRNANTASTEYQSAVLRLLRSLVSPQLVSLSYAAIFILASSRSSQ